MVRDAVPRSLHLSAQRANLSTPDWFHDSKNGILRTRIFRTPVMKGTSKNN
jgi:hypothetical protein